MARKMKRRNSNPQGFTERWAIPTPRLGKDSTVPKRYIVALEREAEIDRDLGMDCDGAAGNEVDQKAEREENQ